MPQIATARPGVGGGGEGTLTITETFIQYPTKQTAAIRVTGLAGGRKPVLAWATVIKAGKGNAGLALPGRAGRLQTFECTPGSLGRRKSNVQIGQATRRFRRAGTDIDHLQEQFGIVQGQTCI